MFTHIVPVSREVHGLKKIKEIANFAFAAKMHIAYVTLQEFARCAPIYPIVFLEDKERDEFRPMVLLGLNLSSNLFVDTQGRWQASYVPAIIRRYPFALTAGKDDGHYAVCIDDGSDLVSDTVGVPLFDDNGAPSQALENVKRYLAELRQMELTTHEFCAFLARNNLFTPLNLQVRDSGKMKTISGCYVINEERLGNLSDELFLSIRKKGFLPGVYGHLISLAQTERLVRLQEGANPL